MPAAAAATTPSCAHAPEDCEYSLPSWKRVPSTRDVLFGLALPYRPPESSLGAFLWRKRLWFETTFALSMLQPWEKLMLRECQHHPYSDSHPRPRPG